MKLVISVLVAMSVIMTASEVHSKTVDDMLVEQGHVVDGQLVMGVKDKGVQARWFSVNGEGLTGPISSKIFEMVNLEQLYLRDNQLTSVIPDEFTKLTKLKMLWLKGNQLQGPIPAGIVEMTNLVALGLNDNQLTGSIPEDIGHLKKLRQFYLSNNRLTGEIPGSLVAAGDIFKANKCDLHGNPALCRSEGASSVVAAACHFEDLPMCDGSKVKVPFQTPVGAIDCDTGKKRSPGDKETITGSCIDNVRCGKSGRLSVGKKCMSKAHINLNNIKCCYN